MVLLVSVVTGFVAGPAIGACVGGAFAVLFLGALAVMFLRVCEEWTRCRGRTS
ncbi:hypothetical protein [Streptomyces tauricus]|uniref:hypothetical protein n=1 Tax=Streptomyces tauricus TaxID=68274 RepID=UPI0034411D73